MEAPSAYLAAEQKLGRNSARAEEIVAIKAALDAELVDLVEDSAHQLRIMGETTMLSRSLQWEFAAAMRLSPHGVDQLVYRAHELATGLPATLAALREGAISWQHAGVIVDEAAFLPTEARSEFENAVLPSAMSTSATRLRQKAKRLREKLHPESITARRAKAIEDRHIWIRETENGMAELGALLPVEEATAIVNKVTELARGLRCAEEERRMPQLQADVFANLLINGGVEASVGAGAGVVAKVWVTVPVMTLLGRSNTPGELEGTIPIAPEVAEALAANASSFIRILTNPETGAVLSMGQERYKPPKDIQNYIRMRDGTCRSPRDDARPVRFADIDHTTPWVKGGLTSVTNLACLCEACHQVKDNSLWTMTQASGGVLEWTSPSKRTYITRPQKNVWR